MVVSKQRSSHKAEAAYEDAHFAAMRLVIRIPELMQELPAPDGDYQPIGWAQVEELTYANAKLAEVVMFLEQA